MLNEITPKFPTKIWNIATATKKSQFEEKKEVVEFDLGMLNFRYLSILGFSLRDKS